MKRIKWLAAIVGMGALLALGIACTGTSTATSSPPGGSVPSGSTGIPEGAPAPSKFSEPISVLSQYPGFVASQTGSSQRGIWVTGLGKVMVEPDLALLNLGIESRAKTVAEANAKAASAMNAIIDALKAHGVAEKDIQTQYFNIRPQYEYTEVSEGGIRTRRQVLVGYTVSNNVAAKIRDLTSIGTVIDDVATAGGDLTRINGISFTVEDTTPLMIQARELAVKDAMAKAQQFADLTGVTLGRLVYIAESGGGTPIVKDFAARAMEVIPAPAAPTPISGGELEIQLTVQAVFDIM